MPHSNRSKPVWFDAERHPIAWFSALLRGVAEQDRSLIDLAEAKLEQLGYFVVAYPPKGPGRGEVAR